jgi:hypothetical protein
MPRRPKRGADVVIPGRKDSLGRSLIDFDTAGVVPTVERSKYYVGNFSRSGNRLIMKDADKLRTVITAMQVTGSPLEITPATYSMFSAARKKFWPGFKFHDQTAPHVPMFGADRFPKMLTTCPFEDRENSNFVQHIIRR